MAEEPKQGKGIGELFVEFGAKGLPSLLKGLNTVSASFLLGKNAANQLISTLTALPKEAGNSAVNIGKMSTALGTSYKEFQKLQMYLKSKNVSEGLLEDVAKLEKIFYDWQHGKGDLPGSISSAFGLMHLDVAAYKGDFNSILTLLDDVEKRTRNLPIEERNSRLRQLGLSSEWGYLWDRGGFDLREGLALSDEEVERNIKAQEAITQAKLAVDQLKFALISRIAPSLEKIADWITDIASTGKKTGIDTTIRVTKESIKNPVYLPNKIIDKTPDIPGVSKPTSDRIKNDVKSTNNSVKFANPLSSLIFTGGIMYGIVKKTQETVEKARKQKGTMTGGASSINNISIPALEDDYPYMPSPASPITQYINITNEQRIQGQNAAEIANKITQIEKQDIEFSQYQAHNLSGL